MSDQTLNGWLKEWNELEFFSRQGNDPEHNKAKYKVRNDWRKILYCLNEAVKDNEPREILAKDEFLIDEIASVLADTHSPENPLAERMLEMLRPYLKREEELVLKKIAFTCERTGKRWQFDSMTKFIEAFLNATVREVVNSKKSVEYQHCTKCSAIFKVTSDTGFLCDVCSALSDIEGGS